MLRYLIRRILWAAVLFFVVTLVTYVIFFLVPNDLAAKVAGQGSSQVQRARAIHYLGLDRPVYVQYGKFMWRLIKPVPVHVAGVPVFVLPQGDLGRSFVRATPVSTLILSAAPVTASLVFGGVIVWLLIALPVGILSALRPRSLLDRASMTFVLIGISAHPVWIGLIFAYVFGFKLGWFPISNYCDFINPSTDCGGPVQWAYHMFLPWLTYAVLFAALYVRMIRANVMEAMNEDYVRTARAKGAPESRVLRSHVLRNALLPVVTMLGMDIGIGLGGAIFTETIYNLPGLGKLALRAIGDTDLPIVMGVVVFATFAIIVFNLLIDLLYAWIDPRIRLS
ncbi:MAG: ABC transporter permease [Actinomycetota bacterium]|jgi:peptide/nickel transport system permease protein|nr:ABC transporter permease [Actinomycetota bacterium]